MSLGSEGINPFQFVRDETIVIYSSDDYIAEYVNICNEIKHEMNMQFLSSPVLTSVIDGFIGYGEQPHDMSKSYNGIRAGLINEALQVTNTTWMIYYGFSDVNSMINFVRSDSNLYNGYLNYISNVIKEYSKKYGVNPNNFCLND